MTRFVSPAPIGSTRPDPPVDEHVLSYPQEQVWFIEQLQPGGTQYNELWLLRLDGPLEPAPLEAALRTVVARHPPLRSTFHESDGRATVRVLPEIPLTLDVPLDVSHLPPADRDGIVSRLAGQFADEPYDLTGPLVRAALIRLDERRHALLIGLHHLVSDGWSAEILLRELDALYGDPGTRLPPLRASYLGYARAQRTGGQSTEDVDFWRQLLENCPPGLDLGRPRLRPPVRSGTGDRLHFDLDGDLVAAADALAMALGTTRAGVLMAALGELLCRYSGRRDVLLGSASEARPTAELEDVIGFFATILPLRLRLDPALTFAAAVEYATELSLDALDHHAVPFPRLVELAGAGRDASCPPLVQVVFTHAPMPAPRRIGPVNATLEQVPRNRARFDLLIEAQTDQRRGRLWIEYDAERFPAAAIRRLVTHLSNLLTTALADPRQPLGDLPMLTPLERRRAFGEPPPPGSASPPRDVVLVHGALLAATDVAGEVYTVQPDFCTVTGDRMVTRDGCPPPHPTGQLGYWDDEGTLITLGPLDRFPSIGGLRVPLAEVEAAIAVHPSVRAAAVTVSGGGLVADIVPTADRIDPVGLLAHVRARLPRHAVPAIRGRLSAPAPDATRDALLAVWRSVLNEPDLGPDDDFFAAGGFSLLATELVDAIAAEFGVRLPVRRIFESPTVAELAPLLAQQVHAAASTPPPAPPAVPEPANGRTGAPLTAAQADIWVVQRLAPGEPVYNVPLVVDIDGPVDVDALTSALALVAARHDALRSRFVFANQRVEQRAAAPPPPLRVVDLHALPPATARAEADRAEREQACRPFDLAVEAPLRAHLFRLPGQLDRLLLTMHHIAVDGVALAVICRELSAAYTAGRAGVPAELPVPELSWGRYAAWEQDWIRRNADHLTGYWRGVLAGLPDLPVPTDQPRPPRLTFTGGQAERSEPAALADGVEALARRLRASPSAVTIAAAVVLLHRRSGADVVPVATPAANRLLPAARGLVGCTINMLVLPIRCTPGTRFVDLVRHVHERTIDAYDHQGLPLPDLIRAAGARRERNRMALFQVAADWQPDLPLRLDGCRLDWRFTATGTARNDLTLTAGRHPGGMRVSAEYNANLWAPATANAMVADLAAILTAAANGDDVRIGR